MISAYSLLKGEEIKKLKDSYVLFIFPEYDPLGKGKTVYEIRSRLEDGSVYEDGMYTYLLNFSRDREKTENENVEELAEYFYNGIVEKGGLSQRIEEIIEKFNRQENWRNTMMTFEQEMRMVEERGRELGREEGKAEGEKLAIIRIVRQMLKQGLDMETISRLTDISSDTLVEIIETNAE